MNEFQNVPYGYSAEQLAPQGFFGSLLGAPLGGLIGKGIGGLLGNAQIGNQIGQAASGIGGAFLPFAADPVAAAYAQQAQQQQLLQQQLQQQQQQLLQQQLQQQQLQQLQQAQLAPQGFFGNLVNTVGRPLGGMVGSWLGNQGLGTTIGTTVGQLGKLLPFGADPSAMSQQSLMAPQHMLSYQIQQLQQQLQQLQQQYAQLAQAGGQQGQIAPQGWLGNLIGAVGQPLGSAIGGAFGNAGLGGTIGGVAGQIGRMLPFAADPVAQAYAQQAQLAQQAQQAQQAQLAPQGWLGNLIGAVGQPLGSAIGGAFGNAGLGSTIGGVAGQIGRMLPFASDPISQAYAQQAQLAQQQGQFGQPNSFFPNQGIAYAQQPTLH